MEPSNNDRAPGDRSRPVPGCRSEGNAKHHTHSKSVISSNSIDTVYTNAKAGMDRVDQDRVKQVVYDLSKGSSYFENEQRKNKATEERIDNLRQALKSLGQQEIFRFQELAKKDIVQKESSRYLERVWLHVDMDAFYCACEQILDPRLASVPFAVGGIGMISTANYRARKYGVRSAMPGFIGRKLCPELEFVAPKFSEYKRFSEKTRDVFRIFDPEFESGSMDEAYLDVTDYMRTFNMTSMECAEEIRGLVRTRTGGLTCSVGIAPNKLIAKICSDMNKPDGVFCVPHDSHKIREFMRSLETRKIPGIGRVSSKILKSVLDVSICGDVLKKAGEIKAIFSEKSYDFFLTSALGIGSTSHKDDHDESVIGRKSKSVERTFTPTGSLSELSEKLQNLSRVLEQDLQLEGLHGKTLTIKIKLSSFVVKTKAMTLDRYTNSKEDMFEHALPMLKSEMPAEVRLMGLRMSNFLEDQEHRDPFQPTLKDMFSKESKNFKQNAPIERKMLEKEWDCVSCTFRNKAKERWCAMCLTSKKTGIRPFARDNDPSNDVKLQRNIKRKKKTSSQGNIGSFLMPMT